MKKISLLAVILTIALSSSIVFAKNNSNRGGTEVGSAGDVRTSKKFVQTCPEKFLRYFDKSEGGPGAYCDCPEENISYLDKSEGGVGFYCAENAVQ